MKQEKAPLLLAGILAPGQLRVLLRGLFFLAGFLLLAGKLYLVQIQSGDEHRKKISSQSIRRIRIPARRGKIFSADLRLLAGNRAENNLVFYPEEMRLGRRSKSVRYMLDAAEAIAAAGEGQNYTAANGEELTGKIREDLSNPTLRSFEYETFQPQFGDYSTILNGISETDIPTLDGFFGTRLKNGAQGILVGDYGQPIYAQWDYGKGKVGSFMCDLNGTWSAEFLGNDTGQQILRNIVGGLFPQESVAVNEIELSVSRENYTVGVNVYTQINDGESIRILVNRTENNGTKALVHTINVENFSGNQTINFDITQGGVYEIEVQKLGVDGSVLASNTAYQEFSYSLEYDPFLAENDNAAHIAELAAALLFSVHTIRAACFPSL